MTKINPENFSDETKELIFLLFSDIGFEKSLVKTKEKLVEGWEKKNAQNVIKVLPEILAFSFENLKKFGYSDSGSHDALKWVSSQLSSVPDEDKNRILDSFLSDNHSRISRVFLSFPQEFNDFLWGRMLALHHDEKLFFEFFKIHLKNSPSLDIKKDIASSASEKFSPEKVFDNLPSLSLSERKAILAHLDRGSLAKKELEKNLNVAFARGLKPTIERLLKNISQLPPEEQKQITILFPPDIHLVGSSGVKTKFMLHELWTMISASGAQAKIKVDCPVFGKRFFEEWRQKPPLSFVSDFSSSLSDAQNRKICEHILSGFFSGFSFEFKIFPHNYLVLHDYLQGTAWDLSLAESLEICATDLLDNFDDNLFEHNYQNGTSKLNDFLVLSLTRDFNRLKKVQKMYDAFSPSARCAMNTMLSFVGLSKPGEEKPFTLVKDKWFPLNEGSFNNNHKNFLRHVESCLSRVSLMDKVGEIQPAGEKKSPKM